MAEFKVNIPHILSLKPLELKAFGLYLKLKARYKNGVIYNYSVQKIAKEFRISEYHTRILIPILIRLDLIKKHYYKKETRFVLTSFKSLKLDNKVQKNIQINVTDSIETVVNKLKFIILRYKVLDKQLYFKKIYTNLEKLNNKFDFELCNATKKQLSRLRCSGHNFSSTENVQLFCGYRKIAKILKMSISSVKEFLNTMVRWRYIKSVKPYIKLIGKMSYSEFTMAKKYDLTDGRYFYKEGYAYCYMGTKIIV